MRSGYTNKKKLKITAKLFISKNIILNVKIVKEIEETMIQTA
jgi:hypothetical protein